MAKILIIEDEEPIRRVLVRVLTEEDSSFDVHEAIDGKDGLKKLDKEFEEFVNEQDSLFNIYSTDFLQWKDFVDLKKIRLKPEKAVVNKYKEVVNYRDKVTNEVIKYIGVPYLWGGDDPSAFDCSGLVQWTIKKTHNILIPRTTKLQYNKWSTFFIYDLFKIKH